MFYKIFWTEYFNLIKVRPMVAQYRWNTDYSKGGWCMMYYYTLEALTFTQESVLNAKVYTESVLDVLTGSNTSWMGSWAYNTNYQTVIEDAFL